MRSAFYIGRIGVLAITLGVGSALTGGICGVAGADTTESPSESAAGHADTIAGLPSAPERHMPTRRTRRPSPGGVSVAQAASAVAAVAPRRSAPHTRTAPPAAATAAPASTAPQQAAASAGADPISTLLNNTSPSVTATQTGQAPDGRVIGTLTTIDPDSGTASVALTGRPAHGTVVVTAGGYSYTPDPTLAHAGFVDSFQVTVDDAASGFHLHGIAGLINLLTFGLIGASGHTTTTTVRVSVAPFNNAPSGTVAFGPPDPLTGTIIGRVIGTDPNGDALGYSGSGTTLKGAVTVSGTGQFSYTPTPQALAEAGVPAAGPADKQDSFTVTLDDGYGGVSALTVTVPIGTSAPELSTFCGCTLMPANTVFHADVRNLAVLPQSNTWTTLLGGTLRAAWGGQPWMNNTAGMPVNIVDAARPAELVIFNRGYSSTGPSIDNSPYAIPDFPIVEGMPNVPAWDRHLLVLQTGTCVSQELYNVANGVELPANSPQDALGNAVYANLYGSAWIAEAGGHVDMSSPLYPAVGWANASRLPYLPLILRPDELANGSIDHMLGIVIAKDRGTGYTWPARAGDGTGTNPDGVPMGTVFRLSADFPIEDYDPATQVVLRALQEHGAVVYDSFGPGQDGAGLLAMSNGWSGTDYLTAQRELSTIPLGAFEAVDVLSLALDPSVGWLIQ